MGQSPRALRCPPDQSPRAASSTGACAAEYPGPASHGRISFGSSPSELRMTKTLRAQSDASSDIFSFPRSLSRGRTPLSGGEGIPGSRPTGQTPSLHRLDRAEWSKDFRPGEHGVYVGKSSRTLSSVIPFLLTYRHGIRIGEDGQDDTEGGGSSSFPHPVGPPASFPPDKGGWGVSPVHAEDPPRRQFTAAAGIDYLLTHRNPCPGFPLPLESGHVGSPSVESPSTS